MVFAVRWLSFRTGLLAIPRTDRWHLKPTPTMGGVGIFMAVLLTFGVTLLTRTDSNLFSNRWSILAGITLMFLVGVIDDLKHIKPPIKLIFQILAATLVIFFGDNTIDFFRWPIANIILTFFWLVGITNAINLLDNMDGLAAGVALITSIFLTIFFGIAGNKDLLVLSLAFAGSILAFLMFNFPPAKIFMGDSGSMVLGFALASMAIARRTQASNVFAIVGVPTLVFLLPILDTGLVTITRILRGQSPVVGGTDHTSHRLVAFGLSERQALLVLYGIALISGLASIGLEALDYDLSLVVIPILLICLSLFVAYLARMKIVTIEQVDQKGFYNWITNITYKRRLFEIIFDLLLIGVSYYLAYWTRYGLNMTAVSMNLFLQSWPVTLVITYASLYVFRVYRGIWRYIGINDLLRYVTASMISGLFSWLVLRFVFPTEQFTPDIFLLYILYLLVGLAGSRSSFLFMDRLYTRKSAGVNRESILLYGAEDAGEIALRWILRNPSIGFHVVGFLDDDSMKWGSNIHGVNILGDSGKLDQIIQEKEVSGIVVTKENLLLTEEGEKLLTACQTKGIWVRVLRLDFELIQ